MQPSTTISQCGQKQSFDVIVLGTGVAGLSYALELTKLRPASKIALISKNYLDESNTYYAQGGIAAVYNSTEDSSDSHIQDTLSAGAKLNNPEATQRIISQGQASMEFLLQPC